MLENYFKQVRQGDLRVPKKDGFFGEKNMNRIWEKKKKEEPPTEEIREFVQETLKTIVDGKAVSDHIIEYVSEARSNGEKAHAIWIRGSSSAANKLGIDLSLDRGMLRTALQEALADRVGEAGTLLTELLRNVLFGTSEEGRSETVMSMRDSLEK